MARPLRVEFENGIYHIMNRGACKQKIFLDKQDYLNFIALLRDICEIYGVQILAYCLMPNHYHILLRIPNGKLSLPMQYLNSCYTQRFNRKYQRDGALFRGRFKSYIIDTDNYLYDVSRYIYLNPVKAKIVDQPEKYSWSSYAHQIGKLNDRFLDFFDKDFVNNFLGFTPDKFEKFVNKGNSPAVERFYSKKRREPVFGSKEFRKNIYKKIHTFDPAIPDQKYVLKPKNPKKTIKKLALLFNVLPTDIKKGNVGKKRYQVERAIAMYICRRKCQLSLKALAKIFHINLSTSASSYLSLFKRRLKEKENLQSQLKMALMAI